MGKMIQATIKTRLLFLAMLLTILFCSVGVAHGASFTNANGTYQYSSSTHFCTDPDSGLNVNYILYLAFSWKTNDGVVHSFFITTTQNSSNGYGADGGVLCGPDDVPTASAYASDGSGFLIVVGGYNSATIYDANGNVVFRSNPPCFC